MQAFDEIYFESIVHKYYDKVYSNFLKKTKSDATAKDLAQITFIKLWQYREGFSFSLPEELQVNRKAKLIFIDWLRKEAYQRKLIKEINSFPDETAIRPQMELTDALQKAIAKLPPTRKKVFSLAYIEGFSHKEIAENLGLSVKTVDAHIFKALQDLRRYLAILAILYFISK